MKVMEHEWVVEIHIAEALAEEGRRGMTFPVVEPVMTSWFDEALTRLDPKEGGYEALSSSSVWVSSSCGGSALIFAGASISTMFCVRFSVRGFARHLATNAIEWLRWTQYLRPQGWTP